MTNANTKKIHLPPSNWVKRFAKKIDKNGKVLDLACGQGRHTSLMLSLGYTTVAADINLSGIDSLNKHKNLELMQVDLEQDPWPFEKKAFSGIIVTNYLHRPLFKNILSALTPNGILIYETFADGNQEYGHPQNANYLLKRGELILKVFPELTILAYEDLIVQKPRPAAVQRVCAQAC